MLFRSRDHLQFQANPFFTQWETRFNTKTLQYFVQDDFKIGPVNINLGWKGFQVDNHARAIVAGGRTVGDLSVTDWFQPHAGLNVELGTGIEAFAGFSQVTRAFASSSTAGPFSSTQAGFNAIKPVLKPEQSDTYEAGLRLASGGFHGVLAAYRVDFRNRLLTIPTSVGIVGSANALQNVGSVKAQGIELTGEYRMDAWTLFGSYSYNDNTYSDNVVITAGGTTTTIPTRGKSVVDSPKHLLHGEIAYDDGQLFGRIAAGYMSKRYFTYTNDQSVPGRVIVDATLGYRLTDQIELQLNASNLLDKQYIATINSGGTGNSGDRQTLLVGAPQQFFVTLKAGF